MGPNPSGLPLPCNLGWKDCSRPKPLPYGLGAMGGVVQTTHQPHHHHGKNLDRMDEAGGARPLLRLRLAIPTQDDGICSGFKPPLPLMGGDDGWRGPSPRDYRSHTSRARKALDHSLPCGPGAMGGVVPAPRKEPRLLPPQPGRPLTLAGLCHLLGGAFLGLKQLLDALRLAGHDRGDPEEKSCPAAPKEDSKSLFAAPNPSPSGHPVVSLADITEVPFEGRRVPL